MDEWKECPDDLSLDEMIKFHQNESEKSYYIVNNMKATTQELANGGIYILKIKQFIMKKRKMN